MTPPVGNPSRFPGGWLSREEGGHSEPLLTWWIAQEASLMPGLSSDRSATLPGSPAPALWTGVGCVSARKWGLVQGDFQHSSGRGRQASSQTCTSACANHEEEESRGDPEPSLGGEAWLVAWEAGNQASKFTAHDKSW